ncbi:MAG: LytTR family transcriptional regulator [Flavobacteriaceae bacterium]|nr:LytTR family transcriptional regulator [Flavobacteriaceae bacterium]
MPSKLVKFLNYPYPFYENSLQGIKISLSIGIFIASFCYFFEPWGMVDISSGKKIGYGIVSLMVCGFYIVLLPLIFTSHLRSKGWKIYKEILWILLICLSLSAANYFYSGYAFDAGYAFNPGNFLIVLLYTFLVAIIPAITIILYKQLFVYKKVIKEVARMDSEIVKRNGIEIPDNFQKKISFSSESKNDTLQIYPHEFKFLRSSGNYLEIFYTEGAQAKKKLIRNSISKLERDLKSHEQFVRCHRSFIVNLDRIIHVNGNLQGYQLEFENLEWRIPVSRRYTKTIKDKILQ